MKQQLAEQPQFEDASLFDLHPQAQIKTLQSPNASLDAKEKAFAEIDGMFRRGLTTHVSKIAGEDKAPDVVQTSLCNAWLHIGSYKPKKPFGVWLTRIARNTAIDEVRLAYNRRASLFSLEDIDVALDGKSSYYEDPADAITKKERFYETLELIGSLESQIGSRALLMQSMGLTYEEIRHELGTSVNSVTAHIYRARRELLPLKEFVLE